MSESEVVSGQAPATDAFVWDVLDAIPDAVLVVDAQGRIDLVNTQAERLFGYDRETLLGMPVARLLPTGGFAERRSREGPLGAGAQIQRIEPGSKTCARHADGSRIPVEIAVSPVRSHGTGSKILSVRDVSAARAAQAHARRVRSALNATHDGVYLFGGRSLRFVHTNEGASEQSGYSSAELLTMTPLDLASGFTEPSLRRLLAGVRDGEGHRGGHVTLLRRKDGAEVPVEVVLQPAEDGPDGWFVAVARDVSARLDAEATARAAEREQAIIIDRERIARDLHARVIQQLFASGMALQNLEARIDDPSIRERVDRTVDELDTAVRDMRTVVFAPSPCDPDIGLRATVRAAAEQAGRLLPTDPIVRFVGPLDTAVPTAIREELLAVLREALSNVAGHARASRVTLELAVADTLVLRISDDADGIAGTPNLGNGLAHLAERATMLGGSCQVDPAPAGGTTLRWSVPLTG
jgi:PAS domain S-box-containing protein